MPSLGVGTTGGLHFLDGSSCDELREGLSLYLDALLVAFPAKSELFAIRF